MPLARPYDDDFKTIVGRAKRRLDWTFNSDYGGSG
jgi:hypothetical protein